MPDYASMNLIIKKSYQNGFGPENHALFKGYYKSVLKLWICTSYSAINDNRNFALIILTIDDLGIYIDAIEWVEITNTRGMSQFADGGIVGTKPI
jgi:deoxyribodipyrimidine photolyase-related protein